MTADWGLYSPMSRSRATTAAASSASRIEEDEELRPYAISRRVLDREQVREGGPRKLAHKEKGAGEHERYGKRCPHTRGV